MVCLKEENTKALQDASTALKAAMEGFSFPTGTGTNNSTNKCKSEHPIFGEEGKRINPKSNKPFLEAYTLQWKINPRARGRLVNEMVTAGLLTKDKPLCPPFIITPFELLNLGNSGSAPLGPSTTTATSSEQAKPKKLVGTKIFAEEAAKIKKQRNAAHAAYSAMDTNVLNRELNNLWVSKKYTGDKSKWKNLAAEQDWKKNWIKKHMPFPVYLLQKDSSLSVVEKFIDKSKLKPDEIIVMFDFDGTLTQKDPNNVKKVNARGGDETRNMIDNLNKKDIKWYINTAAPPGGLGSMVGQMETTLKIPLSSTKIYPGQLKCKKTENNSTSYKSVMIENNTLGVCDNMISHIAKEKQTAAEFILSKLTTPPKLVIFVDDSYMNVYTMYKHFEIKQGIEFIGILYEPYSTEEENQKEALDAFERDKIPILPITDSQNLPQSGGRKTRRNRRNRRRTRRN